VLDVSSYADERGELARKAEGEMNRVTANQRGIKFYSKKNGTTLTVCSEGMRHYASLLESDRHIAIYRVHEAFDMSELSVDSVDIRSDYMDIESPSGVWASDFWIEFDNGAYAIRELVDNASFGKRAVLERLELSRRYWAAQHITDWKVVVLDMMKEAQEESEDEYVF